MLSENVKAIPDIGEAVKDATVLIFVMPHQCRFYFLVPSVNTVLTQYSPVTHTGSARGEGYKGYPSGLFSEGQSHTYRSLAILRE